MASPAPRRNAGLCDPLRPQAPWPPRRRGAHRRGGEHALEGVAVVQLDHHRAMVGQVRVRRRLLVLLERRARQWPVTGVSWAVLSGIAASRSTPPAESYRSGGAPPVPAAPARTTGGRSASPKRNAVGTIFG